MNSTDRAFLDEATGESINRPAGSLGNQRGYLVYFTGPNRSHLFVVEQGELTHVELALTNASKDLVRAYLTAATASQAQTEELVAKPNYPD